jgi:hypothetical protein
MAAGPKLFTCPKCRHRYLGHDPLPDCPGCGYDYREKEGFRWDVLVFLFAILGLMSYMLVSAHYRGGIAPGPTIGLESPAAKETLTEKLPGAGRSGASGGVPAEGAR